ncbi:alpha-crystallin B chain-like [Antennarius striatus]|uniref:alpha-crystallin B chain-like n=1 Tax=Antennarius striatus TaxID=241820 RepID=UPI0035B0E6CF
MDIPIQYPWYRRVRPYRLADLSLAEPLIDWPHMWPLSSSFPWMHPSLMRWCENELSEMQIEKDRFVIHLDVKHFSPDELSVSVGEEFITIHARHEDRKDDHGFVSREFGRKYRLPAGVTGSDVTSSLSADGVLTITALRPAGTERAIPITREDGTPKQKM